MTTGQTLKALIEDLEKHIERNEATDEMKLVYCLAVIARRLTQ